MSYISTKQYGHDVGLSCCFRQWRAESHCNLLHGYALAVRFEFEAQILDDRNWVVDFGSLKPLKAWLEQTFDHAMLVAKDDPCLLAFQQMATMSMARIVIVDATGCEAFAKLIFTGAQLWLHDNGYTPRVWLKSVEVKEHGANSAIFMGNPYTGQL